MYITNQITDASSQWRRLHPSALTEITPDQNRGDTTDRCFKSSCLSENTFLTESLMMTWTIEKCTSEGQEELTHWSRVTHICASKLTIIGSDKGLSPDRRQVIIWTNAGILLIALLGINFIEILIEICIFPFNTHRHAISSGSHVFVLFEGNYTDIMRSMP